METEKKQSTGSMNKIHVHKDNVPDLDESSQIMPLKPLLNSPKKRMKKDGNKKKLDWHESALSLSKNFKSPTDIKKNLKSQIMEEMDRFYFEREIKLESEIYGVDIKNKRLSACTQSGKIHIFDISQDSITLLQVISAHSESTYIAEFNQSATYIFSCSGDSTAKIFQFDSKQRKYNFLLSIDDHQDEVRKVTFCDSTSTIITVSKDGKAGIFKFDSVQKKVQKVQEIQNRDQYLGVAVSQDGKMLVLTGDRADKSKEFAAIYTLENGVYVKFQDLKGHTKKVEHVTMSRDKKYIFTGSHDTNVVVNKLNLEGKYEVIQVLEEAEEPVMKLKISPDCKNLIVPSDDSEIRRYVFNEELEEYELFETYSWHKNDVNVVELDENFKYIVSGSNDKTVKIFTPDLKPEKKKIVNEIELSNGEDIFGNSILSQDGEISFCFHPITFKFVILCKEDETKFTPIYHGALDPEVAEDMTVPSCLSRKGEFLIFGINNTIKIFKIDKIRKKVIEFLNFETEGKDENFSIIVFEENEAEFQLLIGCCDHKIRFYQISKLNPNFELLETLEEHKDWIMNLQTTSTPGKFISSSDDFSIKIWEKNPQKKNSFIVKQTLEDCGGRVSKVACSPKEDMILGCIDADEPEIKIYIKNKKTDLYQYSYTLETEKDIKRVEFSNSGKYLMTLDFGKKCVFWIRNNDRFFKLFELGKVYTLDLMPGWDSFAYIDLEEASKLKIVKIRGEMEFENSFRCLKIFKEIFSSDHYLIDKGKLDELFEYAKQSTEMYGDDQLQKDIFLHSKLNIIFIAVLSRDPHFLEKCLNEFKISRFFFKNPDLNPLNLALKMDNKAILDTLSDFFKEQDQELFQTFFDEKTFFKILDCSSHRFKEIAVTNFFPDSLRNTQMPTDFPIEKSEGYHLLQNDRSTLDQNFRKLILSEAEKLKSKHDPRKVFYKSLAFPVHLNITSNFCKAFLHSTHVLPSTLALTEVKFIIREIWNRNLKYI